MPRYTGSILDRVWFWWMQHRMFWAIRALTIRPGDTIVFEFTGTLPIGEEKRIESYVRRRWPDNPVLLLSPFVTMEVRPKRD